MVLSRKAKEAVKTALAMTITYCIAMKMGWDKPMWAGFAVAFVSLATIGQSLNKSVLRMLGTLVAVIASLTFIALFPQERWMFMILLSTYIGFCTYMMGGTKNKYFWHVCGFVCVIICMSAGPDSRNAFQVAMLRAQETGLGILVYSLVSIFLWPKSSRTDFKAATSKLASTQHQLCKLYLSFMQGQGNIDQAQILRKQAIQGQGQFDKLLDAAEIDSYEVWELRQQWRYYQQKMVELSQLMEGWHESFAEAQALDMQRLNPNLTDLCVELDSRFEQIECMLSNQAPGKNPTAIDVTLNMAEVRSLSHFQKAAVAAIQTRLQNLEELTRAMFDSISDINGFRQEVVTIDTTVHPSEGFELDPERIISTIRVIVTIWIAYLAWIYIDSLPGGVAFVITASIFGMAMAPMPQIPISLLFLPNIISVLVAGLVYIFVMPKLSSFLGLGILIFAFTFCICYLFASPRQALSRVFGLAMFITITSISNQQTYSFLSVANTAVMFPLVFLLLIIMAHIPLSPRPEQAFLRFLRRFFRSCEYLMATVNLEKQQPLKRLEKWIKAFHAREVSTLPGKLIVWAPHIDTKGLPDTSPQQIQSLVINLKMLSYRMQELLEMFNKPQAEYLKQELRADVRAWRLKVQETFQKLLDNPAAGKQEIHQIRLIEIMERLEARIRETFDKTVKGQFNKKEGENFYQLLGAYRGVSDALVEYAG
ncbi:MAG: FUSC family protein, partial [Planctomycetota bacterium]